MIEMRRTGDHQFSARLERAKNVKERHGIRSARERHEHTRAAREHVVLPDGAQNAGVDGHGERQKAKGRRDNSPFCRLPFTFYR
jgi:hypothetical protein